MARTMVSLLFLVGIVCGCNQSAPLPVTLVPAAGSATPAANAPAPQPNATTNATATTGAPVTGGAGAPGIAGSAVPGIPGAAPGTAGGTAAPIAVPPTPSAAAAAAPAAGGVPTTGAGAPATPATGAPTVTADQLFEKAQGQARRGDINGCVTSLREAVAAEPTHRNSLFLLSGVLQQVGGQSSQRGDANGANTLFLESAGFMRKLRAAHPDLNAAEKQLLANALYNEACVYNLQGQADKALASLRESADAGFGDVTNLEQDKDLASLRDRPEYKAIRDDIAKSAVVAAEEARKLAAAAAEEASKHAQVAAKELVAKGESFPFDFQLTDIEDKSVKLADFKGKVLIVDFWGTWCPPCRMEIPHFVELKNKYGKDGLEIVGLNYERVEASLVKETIKRFMVENSINYRCAVGDSATQQKVLPKLEGYPTTLFIDRTGKVRLKVVGYHPMAELEAIVSLLLAEPAPPAGT